MQGKYTDSAGNTYDFNLNGYDPTVVSVPSVFGVSPRQPFRCPVCYGRGEVDGNFYSKALMGTSLEHIPCRACVKGVIWG